MANTPRSPLKPTTNLYRLLEVDDTNPYDGFDRGLFLCMQLEVSAGVFKDSLCRIGPVSIDSYQGGSNACIFTYQVIIFDGSPVTEQDYASMGQVYVDPRNGLSSFSFATLAKDYRPIMVEALCANDFLTYKRAQKPAEWEDIEGRRRVFSIFAKIFTTHPTLSLGISEAVHHQYFGSVDNLPLQLERSVILYRGYEMLQNSPPIVKPAWKEWPKGYYIEFSAAMGAQRLIDRKALEHFVQSGHAQVKHHFEGLS